MSATLCGFCKEVLFVLDVEDNGTSGAKAAVSGDSALTATVLAN